jgi:mannose-6-phosphate isomerase-like protein (cupin superfamily)
MMSNVEKFKDLNNRVDIMSREVDYVLSDIYQVLTKSDDSDRVSYDNNSFQSYINKLSSKISFKDFKVIKLAEDSAIVYMEVDGGLKFKKLHNKCKQQFYIISGELYLSYREKKLGPLYEVDITSGNLFNIEPSYYVNLETKENTKLIITLS